jgi:UDP-N-acetylglucosamine--N-acetylmuramyl-(pentapeptide) pyrophosphoryl-undecaprenol N-acetylglucosamine transferase
LDFFRLNHTMPVVLVIGGSLGARTINHCIGKGVETLVQAGIQVIWQTGKSGWDAAKEGLGEAHSDMVRIFPFIQQMELAYAAASVIVSRAGAGTISELCIVGKPVILVPSPNVAEDHQTRNANALVDAGAALMVEDNRAAELLVPELLKLMNDNEEQKAMSEKIKTLAIPDADERIADVIYKVLDKADDGL